MNKRRRLVVAIGAGALAVPFSPFAQQPSLRMHRIGFLGPTSAAGWDSRLEAFRAGMRDLGYVEGKDLVIEFRWAEGKYDRLHNLAAEMVHLNVDLIVTGGTPGVRAAKQATTTIPIVIGAVGDVVAAGLVANLARPESNITGSSFFQYELLAKRLELLKEAAPRLTSVGFLHNLDNSSSTGPSSLALENAAKVLKIQLQKFPVRGPNEFEGAFADMIKKKVEGVAINEDAMLVSNLKAIAALANKYQLRSTGGTAFAEAGGLRAYGIDVPQLWRRAAYFVDKILRGARPVDLPVEQPTKFELVVNLKAAKTIGIKIPRSILVRADKVID